MFHALLYKYTMENWLAGLSLSALLLEFLGRFATLAKP